MTDAFSIIEEWKAEAERSQSARLRREIEEASDTIAEMLSRIPAQEYFWRLSLPVGWVPLVARLHAEIVRYAPDYSVAQVKEKFGGLRYYVDFRSDRPESTIGKIYALINDAEKRSCTICDVCGGPGTTFEKRHWLQTRCDQHRDYRDTGDGHAV